MSETFIEVRNLTKTYTKAGQVIEVLHGLNLSIGKGEVVAVTGVSGVGKSTLLHLLGGLDRPDSGTISYAGQDLLALSDRKRCAFRNQTIGFIFQFHHLLQEFSALENVIVPGMIRGGRKTLLLDRARELLEAVGLGNRLHHRPTELSGGEQQRVAIARALALSPGVVLADEPTGNLDPATGKRIHELLLTLQAREGTTLIFVTHNRELVTPKTRLVRLERGGLVEA